MSTEGLRAELAAAPEPTWRGVAIRLLVALADAFKEDEVRALLDEVVARTRHDRELLIETAEQIAAAMDAAYWSEWVAAAHRIAADALATDTTPEGTARWIASAIEAVVVLVDCCQDDEATALIDELFARTRHDRALAYGFRRELATRLADHYEIEPAIVQLRAALEVATTPDEQLATATELAALLSRDDDPDAAREVLVPALPRTIAGASDVTVAEAHLRLAALGVDPEQHARLAVERTAATGDVALRHRAVGAYAEELLARGALADAEALVVALPPLGDDVGGLGTAALLDAIRRKRGTLPEEPPPEEMLEEPPAPSERDAVSVRSTVDAALIRFFTPPADPTAAIRDRELASPELIREWSHGPVTCEADLDSERIFGPRRSWWCGCGRYRGLRYRGMVCEHCRVEVISSRARRSRAGHITLATPVVHPWYAPAAARLLDLTPAELAALPIDEVSERLASIYTVGLEIDLADELAHRPGERRARAIEARLAIVRAFTAGGANPSHMILSLVPVPPPEADVPPFAADRAAIRRAFVWLLEGHDEPARAVAALFGWFRRR